MVRNSMEHVDASSIAMACRKDFNRLAYWRSASWRRSGRPRLAPACANAATFAALATSDVGPVLLRTSGSPARYPRDIRWSLGAMQKLWRNSFRYWSSVMEPVLVSLAGGELSLKEEKVTGNMRFSLLVIGLMFLIAVGCLSSDLPKCRKTRSVSFSSS